MNTPAFRITDACYIGMVFDTLAVLCVMSLIFIANFRNLSLVAASHLAVLCFRAIIRGVISLVYLSRPHWFSAARLFAIFLCTAFSSAFIFVGCASATVFIALHSTRDTQQDLPSSDDDLAAEVMAMLLYPLANAMLSTFMWINRPNIQDHRRAASDGSRCMPAKVLTLKDITLHTIVLGNVGASVDHPAEDIDRELCCICLCAMSPGERMSELTCHHRYHTSCLENWDASQRRLRRSTLCPMRCSMTRTHEAIAA
eukprot:TRINITY_DN13703_c0_g2_i1.p1 TRINITY_DN13703_c0_g2~~TRINITY_DN13703_c0_g2_i1.p1  ORF type:complete len:256 (+),score=13.60 TRINITY_DN13703_c0_g2_i1:184-951(+)